jgi:hypothetical protein
MDEALDLAVALANLPLPQGRRVAVVTNGGGAGVLAADEMARRDLILPELPAELIEELDKVLPPFWSRRNPLDMVASAGGDVGRNVLAAVARSDAFDAVVMLSALGVPNTGSHERATSASGEYDGFSAWESDLLALTGELIATSGKPIIHVPDLPMRQAVFAGAGRYSAVVLPSPRAVALTLDRMAWYGDHRRRPAAATPDDHD